MAFYVFDTNTVSLILRRHPTVLGQLDHALTPDNLIIGCPLVWYELR
jgi:hypothetical protein